MFWAGLKFTLGLTVGLTLFSGLVLLGMIGVTLLDYWRMKRRDSLSDAKPAAKPHTVPQIRLVFRSAYRTDDWIRVRGETEYLR
jgi:predicted ATP-dependent Lon-type protease